MEPRYRRPLPTPPSSSSSSSSATRPQAAATPHPGMRLPMELKLRILELTIGAETEVGQTYPDLCNAALIHRSWTLPAQSLLLDKVYVDTEERALLWLARPSRGLYPTKWLKIDGGSRRFPPTLASVREMILSVDGVTYLEVVNCAIAGELDTRVFSSPNLSELTALRLANINFRHNKSSPIHPSFCLDSFELDDWLCRLKDYGFIKLLAAPTLNSLTLVLDETPRQALYDLHDFLDSCGPTLKSLSLNLGQHGLFPFLTPSLTNFVSLTDLSVECHAEDIWRITENVSAKLKSFAISCRANLVSELLSTLNLAMDLPLFEELETLSMCDYTEWQVSRDSGGGGPELVAKLESRGVRIEYDCKWRIFK